ncbi:hypothetical protein [Nonomuraea roseola]|uniref:Uncharacterized protein n=1 Tax=Nonomuraea roseola TaxID=46179 RepID=A0ABV5QEC3_9ACTN
MPEQTFPAFVMYAGGRPLGSWTGTTPQHVPHHGLTSMLRDGGMDR